MAYVKNPENTSAGKPGVYGQSEMENNRYASKPFVILGTGKTITSPDPVDIGMEQYDGIHKMYNDLPQRFEDDNTGRRKEKTSTGVTINSGETYIVPNIIELVNIKFTGKDGEMAILNIRGILVVIRNTSGQLVWNVGTSREHTFTTIGESYDTVIGGITPLTVTFKDWDGLYFSIDIRENLISSMSSSSNSSQSSSASSSMSSVSSTSSSQSSSASSSMSSVSSASSSHSSSSHSSVSSVSSVSSSRSSISSSHTPPGGPLYRVDFTNVNVSMANGTWDTPTAALDSNFGSDGADYWNRFDSTVRASLPGTINLRDSLTNTISASITLTNPTVIADGSGGTGGPNTLRSGVWAWTPSNRAFSIQLGASAAGKTVKIAWYTQGNVDTTHSAINIVGAIPATLDIYYVGSSNVWFQTVTADGSGNISGFLCSSLGTPTVGVLSLGGLQIYVAP